ncbi:ABC transporter permease [[Mycoplasma] mobile]|uniref:Oligopeptide ABC transporter permease protein n=1 Tax=Mycoplasma mobile (strain ATCC 43663 / 163K / NCTC 11711) TaxID=267748 RepID=Q6KHJ4_MYCM1|nr:ABC transporter permease subunit [[Mycoplasma] mobile]AAT27936.1 oligopeptide ABC transporter permease protein [Mycoplasma mobile 163K]
MNRNDFNKKYNIKTDSNSFKFSTNNSVSLLQLVGKPKKNIIEIIKRYFSNPYSVIALSIFLIILLMAIIIPFTSPFAGDIPITNQSNFFNGNLPPIANPLKTQILTNSQRQLFIDIQNQINIEGASLIISEKLLGFNQWEITYNAYELLSFTNSGQQFSTILGTTSSGFDIWTRSWSATIQSLLLAVLVALINSIVGVSLGIYLGFNFGKPIDTFFERVLEVINSLPNLIWVLILVSIVGTDFFQLIIVLVIIGWSAPVAEARRFAILVKDLDFIKAAEAIGASKKRRIFMHLLPNIIGRLAISFVQRIPVIIFLVSSLSFLGFLTDPANLNLGNILVQALGDFSNNPWTLLLPSLLLLTITLSLQFVALGVHDAIDPQLRKV